MAAPAKDQQSHLPAPSRYQSLNVDPAIVSNPVRRSTGHSVLEEGAIEEHGRTYHHYNADTYYLPNDGEEQNRLDMQHKICKLLMDGQLHWAPVQNPRNVLDMATGTGIWAIEFAREHPDCNVIGSDLSTIQPKDAAPNCDFIREDADGEWTLDQKFDYIHFRYFCVFTSDLAVLLGKVYDHLEPGGWAEFQETSYYPMQANGVVEETPVGTAMGYVMKALTDSGRNPWAMTVLKEEFAKAGFVDVVEKIEPLPINSWPIESKYKEIGKWQLENVLTAFEGGRKFILKAGKSKSEADEIVDRAKRELIVRERNFYVLFYIVYARKPAA